MVSHPTGEHWLLALYEVCKLLGVRRLGKIKLLRFNIEGGRAFYPRAYIIAFKVYLNGADPTFARSKDFAETPEAEQLEREAKQFLSMTFEEASKGKLGISISHLSRLLNISNRTAMIYSRSKSFRKRAMVGRSILYDFYKIPEIADWS